jgi:hypothetical protein
MLTTTDILSSWLLITGGALMPPTLFALGEWLFKPVIEWIGSAHAEAGPLSAPLPSRP